MSSAVADMLAKAGNTATDLQCGTHAPGFYDVRGEVPPPPPYSPLAHNCSGKHSGMLAYCVQCGLPKESYLEFDASAAAARSAARSRISPRCRRAELHRRHRRLLGAELRGAADRPRASVRATRQRKRTIRSTAAPRRRLADAMIGHPEMVSGERRNDLALMRAGRGDWVTKIGAEGVQALGIRSRGWGIAVKVGRRVEARPSSGHRGDPRCPRIARRRPARRTRRMGRAEGQELPRHVTGEVRADACTEQIRAICRRLFARRRNNPFVRELTLCAMVFVNKRAPRPRIARKCGILRERRVSARKPVDAPAVRRA